MKRPNVSLPCSHLEQKNRRIKGSCQPCSHLEQKNRRIKGSCQRGRSSLSEKREETALLNKKLKRLDNLVTNNNGNKNDNDVEIFMPPGVGAM